MTDSTASGSFGGGIRRGPTAASHFTIVSNEIARGPKLRFFDKGLLVNLLSHRAGFRITEGLLADQSGDGVKAIRDGLNRLRVAGYVYRSPKPLRHAPGTRNAAGKLIGGTISGYEWSVTDQPDVIAEILAQYARELAEAAALLELELVEPGPEPVDNSATDGDPDPVDNENLPAETAASADLREQGVIPGGDLRPFPPGGIDRAKEDHSQKTITEEDQEGTDGYAVAPDALRLSGPDESAATGQGGPDNLDRMTGDQQTARADKTVPWRPALKTKTRRSWGEVKQAKAQRDPAGRAAVMADLEARRHPNRIRAVPSIAADGSSAPAEGGGTGPQPSGPQR